MLMYAVNSVIMIMMITQICLDRVHYTFSYSCQPPTYFGQFKQFKH